MLCMQVLFSPSRKHWLTVHGTHKQVVVYDSLFGSISQQTKDTIRTIAGRGAQVGVCDCCTQQTLAGDCGPFALAYAITIALGGMVYITNYCFLNVWLCILKFMRF